MTKEVRDALVACIDHHGIDTVLKTILEICAERHEHWSVMKILANEQITIRS